MEYQLKTYFNWRIKNIFKSNLNLVFLIDFFLLFILFFTGLSLKLKIFIFIITLIINFILIERQVYNQGEWKFAERKRLGIPTSSDIKRIKEHTEKIAEEIKTEQKINDAEEFENKLKEGEAK